MWEMEKEWKMRVCVLVNGGCALKKQNESNKYREYPHFEPQIPHKV